MNNISDFILNNLSIIVIIMGTVSLILFVMILCAFSTISKLKKRIRKLTRGIEGENIEKIINKYYESIDNVNKSNSKINEEISNINIKLNSCVQKVTIKRYKAFENVGSDLSFSIAFLDLKNNGVVLTGIYGREDSITYAKPIDSGISRYDLSGEEKEVLNGAMNK
ncbi:MAG: DUF4446 family protein [Clostridiaceae bacterium]